MLCGGRTMKDTTRHKALLNHRILVASQERTRDLTKMEESLPYPSEDEEDMKLFQSTNEVSKLIMRQAIYSQNDPSSSRQRSSDPANDADLDVHGHMNGALNSSSEVDMQGLSSGQESPEAQDTPSPGSSHPKNTEKRSISLPMAPEDRAKWDQVAGLFDLNPTSHAQALNISSITGDNNRYHALVCLMHQLRQDFAKQQLGNCSSDHWKPDPDLGPELMRMMRLTLRCHTIESYIIIDSQTEPMEGSFYEKAMQAINSKSDSWKSEYLPPRFGTTSEDKNDHEIFMRLFRDKLREVLEEFRLILLTHIYTPTRKLDDPVQAVPDIIALQGLLFRFFDKNDRRTDEEINAQIDPKATLRFAYLRLEVVEHHLTIPINRRGGPDSSPWSCVDVKLSSLCEKDRTYQRAFGVLVLTRDEGFFDGRMTVKLIKKRYQCRVPTDHEIESITGDWRMYAT
ncbi:uncharacterized protein MELLADRAFT_86483 [Melampsora larici-populina 98AG31]|uniref:Uncharacterized protein n=1 Tax=Melampsora larici-populina (strain 98AG31 / pathotype 3-4-7) TaxID=747676 RepID=F4RLZ9_MELLP|nr:uncharacterized protein MELLADRAFT_86483 [Melampsora larici-populina 98AG31]EGG06636.1 hypothetical protein MELLADRAFT_86483 [Melampsora larici-populina 98AG31]